MKRGDLVTVALQGDYGKPRPALIIQSDLYDEHPSLVILPVTSELRPAPLFRIDIAPGEATGIKAPSQVMVDKPQTIKRDKARDVIGRADDQTMLAVTRSLAVFLGIG